MAKTGATGVTKRVIQLVLLVSKFANCLTVTLNSARPTFCFDVAKERGVNRPVDINERSTAQIDYDKTLEMHYDISGQGADEVEIKVWRLRPDSRERIFMDKAKIDGYYEADFLSNDELLSICFHSLDYEEKDLSIMLN